MSNGLNLAPSPLQEVCDDDEGAGHEGLFAVLCGAQPLQRLQVPVWGNAQQCLPDAVVRPPQ